MTYRLSKRSLGRLDGVHPDLVAVVKLAIKRTPVDFTVLEGMRSEGRQKALYASGASKTLNSRHLTGHAVDLAPYVNGEVSWAWPSYYPLADAIKEAAEELGVTIEWGGDWKSFKDGPHWQLPWTAYPVGGIAAEAPPAPPAAEIPAPSGLLAAFLSFLGSFRK